ncbi:MAG TPA: hypothetical protein VFA55_03740 [Candidatus Kapabacteria bacterium]|nr:hypothetical protein [Candidatus Kapabacteria bacterium]
MNSDGTSAGDTFHAGPILKESEINDDAPFKEYPAEDATVYVMPGERKVQITCTTYQRDTGMLTFAPTDAAGNYYAVLKQVSKNTINGVYQYLFAPICQIEQSVKYKTLGNEIAFKIWLNPAPANITRTVWTGVSGAASVTFGGSAPSITVNQNQYYAWYNALS